MGGGQAVTGEETARSGGGLRTGQGGGPRDPDKSGSKVHLGSCFQFVLCLFFPLFFFLVSLESLKSLTCHWVFLFLFLLNPLFVSRLRNDTLRFLSHRAAGPGHCGLPGWGRPGHLRLLSGTLGLRPPAAVVSLSPLNHDNQKCLQKKMPPDID